MDLEITARNTSTSEEVQILLREVPDDTLLADLKKNFKAYIAQGGMLGQWEMTGIAKVTFESGNEQRGIDD